LPVQPPPAPPPSATTVRVIPGYPDPASGKIYNLQVGSYSTADAANKAERLIKSHGFNVTQELAKPYYRILVTNVPAASVYATVQRLGAIGVEEVIVR
jgi:cell division protein FtsN